MRVAPINTEQSPIKVALGQNILSSPRTLTSVPVNDPAAYSTVRPGFLQSNPYAHQSYAVPSQHVIRSTVLEPTRQFSTIQPYYVQQPSVAYTRPPIANTQVINYQTLQQPRPVMPAVNVQQSKVVEEIRVSRPVVELEPEVETVVKYEYQEQPKVELGQQSAWDSYYSRQKTLVKPPPVAQAAVEQKSSCNPILIGLLGLLALAGLITAIVLAAKAGSGFGNISNNTQTQGTPAKNQTTFVPPTTTTNSTNSTTTTTNVNKTNSTSVQPTILNPIVVAPNVTAPITTPSTTITENKVTVPPLVNVTDALPPGSTSTSFNSNSNVSPTSTSSNATAAKTNTTATTSTTGGTTPTTTAPSTNTTKTTNTTTTSTTSTTSPTKTTTTTTSTTFSKTPVITQPVFDVSENPQPSHKLKLVHRQQHKMRTVWA